MLAHQFRSSAIARRTFEIWKGRDRYAEPEINLPLSFLGGNVRDYFDPKGNPIARKLVPMRKLLLIVPMVALTGCLASKMQSTQSQGTDSSSSRFDLKQRLSPTAFEQNATMKDRPCMRIRLF
jgi:hypothetical protein